MTTVKPILSILLLAFLAVLVRFYVTDQDIAVQTLKLTSSFSLGNLGRHASSSALDATGLTINGVPYSTRAYWMRRANAALAEVGGSACPFGAFGSVIVNHSTPGIAPDGLGELVCMGANGIAAEGDPTLHGEIAAIQNCSKVLTDPKGNYRLSPAETLEALTQLSLYTNAESCPMCASAIRWANFKEYIFGTSIDTLIKKGWGQISISSDEIFRNAFQLPGGTRIIGHILANETDPYFLWQYDPVYPCPPGCYRPNGGGICTPSG